MLTLNLPCNENLLEISKLARNEYLGSPIPYHKITTIKMIIKLSFTLFNLKLGHSFFFGKGKNYLQWVFRKRPLKPKFTRI